MNIFKKAIKDGNYHFFIFSSPAIFPFFFARHFRIVTIEKGEIHRREINYFKNKKKPDLFYFHIDFLDATKGFQRFIGVPNIYSKSKLEFHVTGKYNSLAHKIVSFVKDSPNIYPYIHRYILFPGPNSNTFIQWILNYFSQIKFQLPRNAFGKNFKLK